MEKICVYSDILYKWKACIIPGQVKVRTVQRAVERLYHLSQVIYVWDYLASSKKKKKLITALPHRAHSIWGDETN